MHSFKNRMRRRTEGNKKRLVHQLHRIFFPRFVSSPPTLVSQHQQQSRQSLRDVPVAITDHDLVLRATSSNDTTSSSSSTCLTVSPVPRSFWMMREERSRDHPHGAIAVSNIEKGKPRAEPAISSASNTTIATAMVTTAQPSSVPHTVGYFSVNMAYYTHVTPVKNMMPLYYPLPFYFTRSDSIAVLLSAFPAFPYVDYKYTRYSNYCAPRIKTPRDIESLEQKCLRAIPTLRGVPDFLVMQRIGLHEMSWRFTRQITSPEYRKFVAVHGPPSWMFADE